MNLNTIIHADIIDGLKQLPDESINCVVTSPPYWGLRDYGTAKWEGGDENCDHICGNQIQDNKAKCAIDRGVRPGCDAFICKKCGAKRIDNQIGLEKTPEEYIEKMVQVFREIKRVLKSDGTVWLNLGDSYNGSGEAGGDYSKGGLKEGQPKYPGRKISNLKPKDLVGIPWCVALALQVDGWWLRQDIIWHKPNPMPESVTDRCTKAHEYIFLLTKSQKYFYDNEAIKEPIKDSSIARLNQDIENQIGSDRVPGKTNGNMKAVFSRRNDRTEENNFTRRKHQDTSIGGGGNGFKGHSGNYDAEGNLIGNGKANKRSVWTITTRSFKEAHFATFPEELPITCIKAGCPEKGIVLDPFFGSGTTGLAALKLNRKFIGIELNPEYIKIAGERLRPYLEQLNFDFE